MHVVVLVVLHSSRFLDKNITITHLTLSKLCPTHCRSLFSGQFSCENGFFNYVYNYNYNYVINAINEALDRQFVRIQVHYTSLLTFIKYMDPCDDAPCLYSSSTISVSTGFGLRRAHSTVTGATSSQCTMKSLASSAWIPSETDQALHIFNWAGCK